jgi:hypothetical protein
MAAGLFAVTSLLAATQPTTISTPPPREDSPMVQAAKRSKRLGKKPALVITNENLTRFEGAAHITTTNNQPELPHLSPPPSPTPPPAEEVRARDAQKPANASASKPKPTKSAAEKAMHAAVADDMGEGVEDDIDPSEVEGRLATAAKDMKDAQKPKKP